MKTEVHLWCYRAKFYLEWEIYRENQNTNFMYNFSFSKLVRLCDNVEKYCRADNITRRMRIAFWIPKSTNIHSQYVIFMDFPLKQLLHEHGSIFRYT